MSAPGVAGLRPGPGQVWIPDVPTPCQADPEMWFPEKGGAIHAPIKFCRGCPVRVDCAAAALAQGERHGIWGGLSTHARKGRAA